jgi:hypothetical protein
MRANRVWELFGVSGLAAGETVLGVSTGIGHLVNL